MNAKGVSAPVAQKKPNRSRAGKGVLGKNARPPMRMQQIYLIVVYLDIIPLK